jgi:hypothetical protein
MPHPTSRPVLSSEFTPLIAYLAASDQDALTLPLPEIEALVGRPLSVTAHTSPSWWTQVSGRHVRDWRAIGWRARLRVKEREVVFRRLDLSPEER